jgi:polysaccharide deacetylase 2 family uncharacterized protein YibQ
VRGQLAEAEYRCRLEGQAIAIGHLTNPATLSALDEELPGLATRGVDLVPPSKLTK